MEKCWICNKESQDLRVLRLRYFWEMSEISDKFKEEEVTIRNADGNEVKETLYSICTCKDCRGDFLDFVQRWAGGECVAQYVSGLEQIIPVRVNGRTVMMNVGEWTLHAKTNLVAR